MIFSDCGVYVFLVQAKKLNGRRITKDQLNYKKDGHQLASLIDYSNEIAAFPIYVLFSQKISSIECHNGLSFTVEEGVFFEPAESAKKAFEENNQGSLSHKPISCLFSSYNKRCYYSLSNESEYYENDKNNHVFCDSCDIETCRYPDCFMGKPCLYPFSSFLNHYYGLKIPVHNYNDSIFLFDFAESIIQKKKKLAYYFANQFLNGNLGKSMVSKIIVTSYVSRHSDDFTKSIMGDDFEINHTTVLELDYIIRVLQDELDGVREVICKVGLFGSYSRQNKMNYKGLIKPPTENSDIDIAIVYSGKAFSEPDHAQKLINFVKNVISKLNKNVDYIDYVASTRGDETFKTSIDKYMIWIKPIGGPRKNKGNNSPQRYINRHNSGKKK